LARKLGKTESNKSIITGDSFQNLIARVGKGTDNQNTFSTYSQSTISRNRVVLDNAYRSSWIAGKAVDAFSEDMTREGVEIRCGEKPEDLAKIEGALTNMVIWDRLRSVCKWARLYGGAIGVLMIDGQDVSTPLNTDKISKGQFKGLLVLDRWTVNPSLSEIVEDFGIHMGEPKYYATIADGQGMKSQKIHYSRVIRMDGVELPYYQRMAEMGWGQSVLERLWDRLISFDSTTEGAAQLVYKAHLRTYGVKGLREIIGSGGKALEGLIKQMEMIRAYQSNEGLTLMDSEDIFESHSYSFGGLSDMLMQFGQQLSGAMDIPLVRLFGQSPAGLNSTGESDMRNYYDNIKQQQNSKLRDGVTRIYQCAFPSVLGKPLPPDFDYDFRSLWQMDDTQKADMGSKVATAVKDVYESGIIGRQTALKELKGASHVTGLFTNITDEEINAAEDEPPPGAEGEDLTDPGDDPPAAKKTNDADWNEADHPRKDNGQFGSGGSGSGKASKSRMPKFAAGGVDSKGNVRTAGLNKHERRIESTFYNAIEKNPDVLIAAYHEANGNVIDPDEVKKLNPKFAENPDLASAVHEPSSKLAKMIYAQALEAKAARGDTSPIVFTAGGSGSGKSATSPVAKKLLGAQDDALVYDSTLSSFNSAKSRIDQALASGESEVGIVYTNTPLERALEFNAKRGRSVSIDTLLHAHHGASKTIRELEKHYADNPRVKILVMNNYSEGVDSGSIKDVPNYEVFSMRERLKKHADALLAAGKITEAKYKLLIR
jgi:phage-related protein (TIGR01555 family)